VFDAILTELEKHKDLFKGKKRTKATPRQILATLISKVVKDTGLVNKTVSQITGVVGPNVLDIVKEQSIELDLGLEGIDESAAIERFTQRRMSYYKDIPDTLSDNVMDALGKGIEEGRSYQEVRDHLMQVRTDFSKNHAEMIARTELGRSRREAKLIFAEKHKDILNKKWINTSGPLIPEGRRRKSHRKLSGKTIPIDEPFIVDYSLDNNKLPSAVEEMYPGESIYGISCACTIALVKREKRRIYIESPKDAPEGANAQQGPRGGYYYESGGRGTSLENIQTQEELINALIEQRGNIGKPKFNYQIGKAGEELVSSMFEGFNLHNNWNSPIDMSNSELIEIKTTATGQSIISDRARKLKISESEQTGKEIAVYLLHIEEDTISLYEHKPSEKFFDSENEDVYIASIRDSKRIKKYKRDEGWVKV